MYEPYVLPGNQLFRPPKSKVDNLKRVDYLGKHKVVSELPESRNNNNKDVSIHCQKLTLFKKNVIVAQIWESQNLVYYILLALEQN